MGTVVTALIAAPAAVYAAFHTRRAADAAAKAATEAANQVKELKVLRAPNAAVTLRVPDQLTGEHQIRYGRGGSQYRSGSPVYLDVWNVGGPTIMVMEVIVNLDGYTRPDGIPDNVLTPQLLVESGKVASINIAYQLMSQVSSAANEEFINIPSGTTASAKFAVKYFSVGGETLIEAACDFRFIVTDDQILTYTGDSVHRTVGGGNYFVASSGVAGKHRG